MDASDLAFLFIGFAFGCILTAVCISIRMQQPK